MNEFIRWVRLNDKYISYAWYAGFVFVPVTTYFTTAAFYIARNTHKYWAITKKAPKVGA